VGISNFGLGYLINNISFHVFDLKASFELLRFTEQIAITFVAAYVLAEIIAMIWGYIFNKIWSFEDKGDNVASQFSKYFAVSSFNFMINQVLYGFILYEVFTEPDKTIFMTSVAQFLSTAFQVFTSYFFYKYVVFTHESEVISEATAT
jgi:putative flippase GtrA